MARIEEFVAAYNKTKAPFNSKAIADSILETLKRLCSQISGTGHMAALGMGLNRGPKI